MQHVIALLNSLVGALVDLLLWPMRWAPAGAQLVYLSALCGVLFLLIYGKVSNQRAIADVKRGIYAAFLEAIIFRHDLKVSLAAQGRMLVNGTKYFLLAVPPLIVLLIPCLFLLGQLFVRFGVEGLRAGEPVLLTAKLREHGAVLKSELQVVEGLTASEPVRIPSTGEIFWRLVLRADKDQSAAATAAVVKLTLPEGIVEQPVSVGGVGVAAGGLFASWLDTLVYGGRGLRESESGEVAEFSVEYPESSFRFLGLHWNWIVVFFLASLASGLVASKWLGVEV